jgi:hypothetical protein
MAMDSNIVKFPYDVSRRVHSRKPRKSHNGTPEERAAKAAAGIPKERKRRPKRPITGHDWDEFVRLIGENSEPELMQGFLGRRMEASQPLLAQTMKRRSHRKRNRQRIAAHARRLRR